ncbi:protein Hnh [Pseudomonas sp. 148P]|uniref:Protein Hnh n=1 Tax=Pseudomonas ulcerans TaxID=3115852 RepID=A0ABU7HNQ1_9PSED|nr:MULTISPECIES: protein Hnh [unclassified Pseudomonas]MEE1923662.1 protein Hnh [Pseudomonas sp. 147P]MEE1933160.1 protein Hnh [Pseudomonas sp. 148P]
MIKVKKTPDVPPALAASQKAMDAQLVAARNKNLDVVLCTKGTAAAKATTTTSGVVKIIIDDEQYKPPHAKALLKVDQHGKCAFCEARFMDTAGGDVEHFRPKKRYDGFQTVENVGYFQYVYDWSNHLWSCKECNETYKKNYFDVMPDNFDAPPPDSDDFDDEDDFWAAIKEWGRYINGQRDNWNTPHNNERPVLIDPINEDPREFISFDISTGLAMAGQLGDRNQSLPGDQFNIGRGGKTINTLGLNRKELVFTRMRHLSMLRGVFLEMTQNFDQVNQFMDWQRKTPWVNSRMKPTMRYEITYPDECVVEDDASQSALQFLAYSTTPQAPFAALARDALACWSLELLEHLLAAQQQATQLQAPDSAQALSTRSVHELPRLGLHPVILATYQADMNVLADLRKNLADYKVLWENGYEQSEVEYVCRKRLEEVMKDHLEFLGRFSIANRHKPAFYDEYLKHERNLIDVHNALEYYKCDRKNWESAVETMTGNLGEYGPDLEDDLIPRYNTLVDALEHIEQNHFRGPYDPGMEPVLIGQSEQEVDQLRKLLKQRSDAFVEIDRKYGVTSGGKVVDPDDANSMVWESQSYTDSMEHSLNEIVGALTAFREGRPPQTVAKMQQEGTLANWKIPTATGVRNRTNPPANTVAAWNHIREVANQAPVYKATARWSK